MEDERVTNIENQTSQDNGDAIEETFKKRTGTTDSGKDYEHLFIAYLIPKLIQDEEVKDFYISSNDEKYGIFDDVVVFIDYGTKREIYACQLKHCEDKKKLLKTSDLLKAKGDFAIEKYLDDYYARTSLQNSVTMILFCNRILQITDTIENGRFKAKVSQSTPMKHLQLSETGSCSAFTGTNHKEFFDNFFIYSGQANVKELKKATLDGLKEVFACEESVFNDYYRFICDWSLMQGNKHKLGKENMRQVLTMCVLSPHIKPLLISSSSELNRKAEILRGAFAKFSSRISGEWNCRRVRELWKGTIQELNNLELVNATRIKYRLGLKPIKQIEDLDLENKETNKLFWLLEKCPLLVEECEQCYRAMKFSRKQNFILLNSKNRQGDDPQLKLFRTLSDLKREAEDIYEQILEDFTYSLEGQRESALKYLLEICQVEDCITVDHLVQMTEGPLRFGEENEALPTCHISRTLSKIVISTEYLNEIKSNTLVTIDHVKNPDDFQRQFRKATNSKETRIGNSGIYFSTNECPLISSGDVKYHRFKYLSDNHLEWIRSTSDIDDLKEFRLEHNTQYTIKECQLYDASDNDLNILCANPGMGKTTLMKSLKRNSSSKLWTILINARNHALHFNKHKEDVEEFLKHIFATKRYKNLDRTVFESFLAKGHVQIIWDGLDEVTEKRREPILKVAKELSLRVKRGWITSRKHLRKELETTFGVFSREILELDEEEQEIYIEEKLSSGELSEKIRINIRNNRVLGVPQHIYMLTELFRIDKSKYLGLLEDFSFVIHLYQHFVEEKIKFYFIEKEKCDLENEAHYERYEIERDTKIEDYKRIAFRSYFSADDTSPQVSRDPLGFIVMEDGNPEFIHKSFGEYFAALYLCEHHEIQVDIFKVEHDNIRFFRDLILSENCKGHVAVLYKNGKLLEECGEEDLQLVDKVGRDILQLSCSWHVNSFRVPFLYPFGLMNILVPYFRENANILRYDSLSNQFPEISLTLKRLMILFPATIPYYRDALDRNDYKHLLAAALYYGIKFDYPPIFSECIEINPSSKDSFKCLKLGQFLKWALDCKSIKCVEELVIKYNCHNILLGRNCSPKLLLKTCDVKFDRVFRFLVNNSLNLEEVTNFACSFGDVSQVKYLIDNNYMKVNFEFNGRMLPIHFACTNSSNSFEIANFLIKNHANVNAVNMNGQMPLHYACQHWSAFETVQVLLNNNAKIDVRDNFRKMPIHYACENIFGSKIVELLIEKGATLDAIDGTGRAPIHHACRNKYCQILQMLVEKDANVNVLDGDGQTPLHHACQNANCFPFVRLLIEHHAETNIIDRFGRTPIHYSSMNACRTRGEIELLIKNNGRVDVVDNTGVTPLQYACKSREPETIQLLIDNGAKVDVVDHNGVRPIHYACINIFSAEIVGLLIQKGAAINVSGNDGRVPLHYACQYGRLDTVKLLTTKGAELNAKCGNGQTPLHYASKNCYIEIVEFLISKGTKVDVVDGDNKTPLDYARNRKRKQFQIILKLLNDAQANGSL